MLRAIVLFLGVFGTVVWGNIIGSDLFGGADANAGAPIHIVVPSLTSLLAVPGDVGVPLRITIPRIAVDAVVESVTLTADGSMGIPKRPKDAAWYSLGPRPGEVGSAVISGHVNWLYGATAAFARLSRLKPGDKIAIRDDKGAIIMFSVRESRKYDAAADTIDIFSAKDGKAHLNLITCAGVWDKKAKQYSQRLVVFADKDAK